MDTLTQELPAHLAPPRAHDPEYLRAVAWQIGETRADETHQPSTNHVGLAMVTPVQGFAHWHITPEWVEETRRSRGDAWTDCRLVLRLYDVSYIEFTGLNAHRLRDHDLPGLSGHMLLTVGAPGTWQLGEVGFRLRNGEFLPAARSQATAFSREAPSPRRQEAALLVSPRGRIEEIGNVWEHEQVVRERYRPRLRHPLRIALLTFGAGALGHEGASADFASELAAGLVRAGHEVHVFIPASADAEIDGVKYHALEVRPDGPPVERAEAFRQAALDRIHDFLPFDLIHMHEWLTGLVPRPGAQPVILSLSSLESTRRNDALPDTFSQAIAEAEAEAAEGADCILTPAWLRERALAELEVDSARVLAFPLEGRLPNEWEAPLDYGQVKKDVGVGPLDRMLLFVGPLEHAAGVDILLEALPVLLHRANNLRLVFAGSGPMEGALRDRVRAMNLDGAVRILGHVEAGQVARLLRAAEALVLPSRCRVPFDDAVVDLARKAGRPVLTTQGGPAHLVRHEETGLVTYDNPGSMVWAVDRILGDPGHAERMGKAGRHTSSGGVAWAEVARLYLELCSAQLPELNVTPFE